MIIDAVVSTWVRSSKCLFGREMMRLNPHFFRSHGWADKGKSDLVGTGP